MPQRALIQPRRSRRWSAGYSDPCRIARVALEIWWSRSEIPHPCCGPSPTVLRIKRSSVPCGSSIRLSVIGPLPLRQDTVPSYLSKHKGEFGRWALSRGRVSSEWKHGVTENTNARPGVSTRERSLRLPEKCCRRRNHNNHPCRSRDRFG